MDRRSFITSTGMAAVAMALPNTEAPILHTQNKLPQWKGFNLLDFFSPDPTNSRGVTSEDHLRWMQDWGFNFIRIPIAYP
jgi:endoglucanase